MSHVEITDLEKSFGAHKVLENINLSIPTGSFVVLVGPSGCGKSTLLRMIAGLEDVSGGLIRIDSREVNDLEPKERDIAMVFQSYALYPHMTVDKNIGFPLRMRKYAKPEIDEKVQSSAAMLGLQPLLDRRPKQLSGGQRQRVAMGRAMVRSPKVFLFDEPLSNLDAQLRVQMRGEIRELQQELGVTTIYVTHDQTEAMSMSDYVVVMRDGRIEQFGTPLDIYDNPNNTFVAQFIGSPSMNIVDGHFAGGEFHLEDGRPTGVRANHEGYARLGFRPHDTSLAETGIPMSVGHVEELGVAVYVVGHVGAHSCVVVERGRPQVKRNDRVYVRPDASRIFLFDEQGQRLRT